MSTARSKRDGYNYDGTLGTLDTIPFSSSFSEERARIRGSAATFEEEEDGPVAGDFQGDLSSFGP